ncbi:MAG TPA: hypothetical protein VFH33_06800, partial [Candidatus Krumholzibacteria bacterium]|nr:hypothetical protein [Candidatus Krumholzibacteria bacterium]
MFESSSARAHHVLSETDQIVAHDRKLTVRLLKNLHEIERNKFYLELGYGSMFDYLTGRLRYSEPSASRRIRTARCVALYPQLLPLLESGDVNLTTVAMIAAHINPGNADTLIEAIKNKSTRDVERLIAALQPLSVLPPDRVRPVVVPVVECANFVISADRDISPTAAPSPEAKTTEQVTTQPTVRLERRARVEFTAHEELMNKLEKIRSLTSHRLPMNAPLEQLIGFMADYFLEREDPEKRHGRREARVAKGVQIRRQITPANPRQIPARVRDQVFARDKRCTYVGPDGKQCA